MRTQLLLFTTLLAGTAPLAAAIPQSAPAAPTTAPATRPAEDFAALVRQLGDDNFHIRQEAGDRLKAAGKAAVSALHEARKSQDPEVRARADELLLEIETPVVVAQPIPQATGIGNQAMSISVTNGSRIVDLHQPGRYVHIEESAAGIAMKITGQLDGKEVTREYKARNAAQLQKENPDAFALYQQSAGGFNVGGFGVAANINVRINGGGGIAIQPGGVQLQQLVINRNQANNRGDNLQLLNQKLLEQMKAANLPAAQQDQVKGLVKQLEDALPGANPGKDPDAQMRDYNARSDALRKRVEELKLPDPGELLPPPAAARLGITTLDEPVAGQGLVITHILPDSRGAKIGLKEQDVIQKVNGNDIHTTHDLRKMLMDHPKDLIIEGLREGKPFKVTE